MPPASMTTSALSTAAADAVPTETMRSSSVMIASPAANGSRQLPETIWPRLTIATFISVRRAELGGELIGVHQVVHHAGRAGPIEGAIAVAGGDEARAGIEHLVLGVARAEFRSDRVPRGFQELDLLFRAHLRG